jgi:hypothetical protein
MTTLEKIELTLIPFFCIVAWFITTALPKEIPIGHLILATSALLLFQGLIRDLFLLARKKKMQQKNQYRSIRCICLESSVGVTGILLGASVLGLGVSYPVVMGKWEWSILVLLVLATGLMMKDLVVESRPWRIVRDKNHMNIIFTLK